MNTEANNPMEQDFNKMIEEYDQYEWQYLKTKEELRTLWSLDVMTYTIYWPGAQGAPGFAYFVTNRGLAYAIDYVFGDLTYDDLRSVLPNLPERFDDLKPWEANRMNPYLPKTMEEFGKMKPWDFDGYQNIDGWYWYGLHSGCWTRIHESIWPTFYTLSKDHKDLWIARYWGTFTRKAIADRTTQLEAYMEGLEQCEFVHECTGEEAKEVARLGVVAWKESDQGWGGLLCKNGKVYFRLDIDFDKLQLPTSQRQEIRNNSLPDWQCYYCGLGHRLMIREEYYPKFRELTYGMGKNADLFRCGFAVLKKILEMAE